MSFLVYVCLQWIKTDRRLKIIFLKESNYKIYHKYDNSENVSGQRSKTAQTENKNLYVLVRDDMQMRSFRTRDPDGNAKGKHTG